MSCSAAEKTRGTLSTRPGSKERKHTILPIEQSSTGISPRSPARETLYSSKVVREYVCSRKHCARFSGKSSDYGLPSAGPDSASAVLPGTRIITTGNRRFLEPPTITCSHHKQIMWARGIYYSEPSAAWERDNRSRDERSNLLTPVYVRPDPHPSDIRYYTRRCKVGTCSTYAPVSTGTVSSLRRGIESLAMSRLDSPSELSVSLQHDLCWVRALASAQSMTVEGPAFHEVG